MKLSVQSCSLVSTPRSVVLQTSRLTGRAGRENQPIGPCYSVLVVDVRPAESEP